jgi:glutathione synthase/RimK-type ligase-like ATP-grasp enzyme
MGVPTTLSAAGLVTGRNEFATMRRLKAEGLRIPESFFVASKTKAGDVVVEDSTEPQIRRRS